MSRVAAVTADYACLARIERGSLTLKRLRGDFANPARLVGCGAFARLAARDLAATRQGGSIELRFTITHTSDVGDAAQRAAELVRILARGQTQHIPVGTVSVTRRTTTATATSPPSATETRRIPCA